MYFNYISLSIISVNDNDNMENIGSTAVCESEIISLLLSIVRENVRNVIVVK